MTTVAATTHDESTWRKPSITRRWVGKSTCYSRALALKLDKPDCSPEASTQSWERAQVRHLVKVDLRVELQEVDRPVLEAVVLAPCACVSAGSDAAGTLAGLANASGRWCCTASMSDALNM